MDFGLVGKIAAVAGASKGLGRAIATALAHEGAEVVLCARDRARLEDVADKLCQQTGAEIRIVDADLGSERGVERFMEAASVNGGPDILVSNTGGPPPGSFLEIHDDQAWMQAHEQLLLSAIRMARLAIPRMKERGSGRIINITSITVKQPAGNLILSNAYRAAVVSMAKTLSREVAPFGITVNNVCPGYISTDRLASLDQNTAEKLAIPIEQVRTESQKKIPLGRYGQPEELAALVAFLSSVQASYITGTTIQCDGGLYSGLL
jgi:3-oxoacyl-[acyl-carrier protein] reductase